MTCWNNTGTTQGLYITSLQCDIVYYWLLVICALNIIKLFSQENVVARYLGKETFLC